MSFMSNLVRVDLDDSITDLSYFFVNNQKIASVSVSSVSLYSTQKIYQVTNDRGILDTEWLTKDAAIDYVKEMFEVPDYQTPKSFEVAVKLAIFMIIAIFALIFYCL